MRFLEIMTSSFEPYTSALPEKKELLASIRAKEVLVAMEDDKMLGFLRFGTGKEVSVLWQVADERSKPEERAYGKIAGETLDLAGEGQRTALSAVGADG